MKNAISLMHLFFMLIPSVGAQFIERSVISSFGFSHSDSNLQSDCTLGEVITFIGEGNENSLTQGFHQPISIVALCQTPHEETIEASACSSYLLNGETYTSAGSYTQLLIAEDGCDSIIYLNLQLNTLSNLVTTIENNLIAAQENASYAWRLCGEQEILSTSQIFTPSENGDYQVTITQEDCEVVSECISFVVGVEEVNDTIELTIFPNPTRHFLNVAVNGASGNSSYWVYDALGRPVMSGQIMNSAIQVSVQEFTAGAYLIVVRTNQSVLTRSFVKS
jgi:hypothetical protein